MSISGVCLLHKATMAKVPVEVQLEQHNEAIPKGVVFESGNNQIVLTEVPSGRASAVAPMQVLLRRANMVELMQAMSKNALMEVVTEETLGKRTFLDVLNSPS